MAGTVKSSSSNVFNNKSITKPSEQGDTQVRCYGWQVTDLSGLNKTLGARSSSGADLHTIDILRLGLMNCEHVFNNKYLNMRLG